MRIMRFIAALILVCSVFVSGCGSGKANNGSLVIASAETDSTTFSQFDFTIAYTNPSQSNVLDTQIDVTTSSPSIAGANASFSYYTNNSGVTVYTYLLPRDPDVDQLFVIQAKTGDLVASKAVVVPKQGTVTPTSTMAATPPTITFSSTAVNGDTQNVIISGGSGSYSVLNVNPSPNPNIGATISGANLTVTKKSSVTGGVATVLVVDTSSPPNSVAVTVNY